MEQLSARDKSVLAGLYLSKFNSEGLRRLGFENFAEAFNVIGAALTVRPASLKNYRDEFDPLFPNKRKGWHKRPIRLYCKSIYDRFGSLGLDKFSDLLKRIVYKEHDLSLLQEQVERKAGEDRSFANRLITGQAAEQYFRLRYREIDLFKDCERQDTTNVGCGFDFRLVLPTTFYGVEVKGMAEARGTIALTSKEHSVAWVLRARFFLFVVKNFRESPFHEVYQDPLNGGLAFNRVEQMVRQVTWTAKL